MDYSRRTTERVRLDSSRLCEILKKLDSESRDTVPLTPPIQLTREGIAIQGQIGYGQLENDFIYGEVGRLTVDPEHPNQLYFEVFEYDGFRFDIKNTKLRDILSEFIIDEKSREIHPINEPRLLKVCY